MVPGADCGVAGSLQECLTPETTVELLESCKKGAPLPLTQWGSRCLNGQMSCEGPLGKQSLHKIPTEPFCRELPEKKVRVHAPRNLTISPASACTPPVLHFLAVLAACLLPFL